MFRIRFVQNAVACLLLAASLAAGAANPSAPRPVTPRGDLGADEKATIKLFERARDSVVFISTKEQVQDFWTRNVFSVPSGTGSGFIWDDTGHVVTNFHVIEGASEATIKLADGSNYKAKLVGASPEHDIAVLAISTGFRKPDPVPIGTSRDLKVGQKVFAIGNPFGLDWTLTSGIISALDRSLDEGGNRISHLIQTDAAINPGNSGGPLLDSAGRLIGINTAIYSPSGTSAGIGFSVPVDTVNRIVPQLIRYGKYVRPGIGVDLDENINRRLSRLLDIRGVIVLRVVPNSPAAEAGLRGTRVLRTGDVIPGDVIVAANGKPMDDVAQFNALLDDLKVGDTIRLVLLRQGKKQELSLVLQGDQ